MKNLTKTLNDMYFREPVSGLMGWQRASVLRMMHKAYKLGRKMAQKERK